MQIGVFNRPYCALQIFDRLFCVLIHTFFYDPDGNATKFATVEYREGVFVGYRGYERAGIKPLFPFGFGLSYTSFKYSDLKVNQLSDGQVEVAFTITNTGKKGFEKVSLRPGESKHVTVLLDRDAFMYYDVISESFRMQPGVFSIMVGRSSADIVLNADIKL